MGNWKMNKLISEANEFTSTIGPTIKKANDHNIDIGVAPTYLCLDEVVRTAPKGMLVAAQNCHYEPHGAFTGEISIEMLQELGVNWCIIGHSERRTYFNETDEACNLKIKALIAHHMVPLYCVGETLEQFEAGITKEVVRRQVVDGLKDLTAEDVKTLVIAYEPVWSIGTGKNASTEIAQDVCSYIRGILRELFGAVAEDIRVLYGGSVKPENIRDYLTLPDVDGALVGGASLKIDSYQALLDNII